MPSCNLHCPTCNQPLTSITNNQFACDKPIIKIAGNQNVKYNHFDIKFDNNQIVSLHWEHNDFAVVTDITHAVFWTSKTELTQFNIQIPANLNLPELLNTIQHHAQKLIKFQSFI